VLPRGALSVTMSGNALPGLMLLASGGGVEQSELAVGSIRPEAYEGPCSIALPCTTPWRQILRKQPSGILLQ
jgi:hypothetical protein